MTLIIFDKFPKQIHRFRVPVWYFKHPLLSPRSQSQKYYHMRMSFDFWRRIVIDNLTDLVCWLTQWEFYAHGFADTLNKTDVGTSSNPRPPYIHKPQHD